MEQTMTKVARKWLRSHGFQSFDLIFVRNSFSHTMSDFVWELSLFYEFRDVSRKDYNRFFNLLPGLVKRLEKTAIAVGYNRERVFVFSNK